MKRFKLLPIALILVLIAVPLAPATVLAASLTDYSIDMTDQSPSANATYTINFKTATQLSACLDNSTYSQFIIQIEGVAVIPPADNYTLKINDTPRTWEGGGGAPSAYGNYTVMVVNDFPHGIFDTIYIKFRHPAVLPAGTKITVEMAGVTNNANTGSYGLWAFTRDQADTGTDVDDGYWGYLLRRPGELVCQVSGEMVSIMVNPGNVDYGVLAIGADKNTAQYSGNNNNGMASPQTQEIHNNGTLPCDLEIKSSNAMHMPWGTQDWVLSGAKGDEQYTHSYNIGTSLYDGSGPITFTNMTTGWQYIDTLPNDPSGFRYLELEIGMPDPTVDYATHQITVTIRATQS